MLSAFSARGTLPWFGAQNIEGWNGGTPNMAAHNKLSVCKMVEQEYEQKGNTEKQRKNIPIECICLSLEKGNKNWVDHGEALTKSPRTAECQYGRKTWQNYCAEVPLKGEVGMRGWCGGEAKKGKGSVNTQTCQQGCKKGNSTTTVCLEAGQSLVSSIESMAGTSPMLTAL